MTEPEPTGTRTGTGTGTRSFLCGVVEGFYGRPWTMEQRTELFRREQRWGLNAFLYAPKDDYKHRLLWRELYSPQEAEELAALIAAARRHQVEFIYAISPGLDITFSNPRELDALKRKLEQVRSLGCASFSLLFDDIEAEMCGADKEVFSSFAKAQTDVTNKLFTHLERPRTFLFCPTDYCASFCSPSVSQSSYLLTVGAELLPGIDVLWTGPKVVSQQISVESIQEVSAVLRRPPVIWDNIHANDYDPQRLFLGPYKGRAPRLLPLLNGVLTNPNCEFHTNFVAVHTLATWRRAAQDGGGREEDAAGGDVEQDGAYSPRKALTSALSDWLQELMTPDQPRGRGAAQPRKEASEEEPMQTDTASYVPGPRENPLYAAEPLTLDDLQLLADLFYLPYEHGTTALTMLRELDWIQTHSHAHQTAEWRARVQGFDERCEAVVLMFNRVSNAPNRGVLYDLYDYICDIKSAVGLARAFVKTLGGSAPPASRTASGDPEPWGFRGGLSGEFQRMLPGHGNRDLFRRPPPTAVFTIRDFSPEDQVEVLRVSMETQRGDEESSAGNLPPLLSDGLCSGSPPPSSGCALVLEDEVGLCGFALALKDCKPAADRLQGAVSASLLEEFPSLMVLQVLPRVTDPTPAKRMMTRLLENLRRSGSPGVFSLLRSSDRRMIHFYQNLQTFREPPGGASSHLLLRVHRL